MMLFFLAAAPCNAAPMATIQNPDVTIFFAPPLEAAARELANNYPILRSDMERALGLPVGISPTIVLVKERADFERMAGGGLIVAYALPERLTMVIDYSRANVHPFTLPTTVKHELCHLALHRYVGVPFPRWLDEGICQWASEGFAEVITGDRTALLARAAAAGNYIPLDALSEGFPRNDPALALAYEESKSFVEYLIARFGREKVFYVLAGLRGGASIENALTASFLRSLPELEKDWHGDLKGRGFWLAYVSRSLYLILFAAGGVILVIAFVRYIRKKRAYRDEDDDLM